MKEIIKYTKLGMIIGTFIMSGMLLIGQIQMKQQLNELEAQNTAHTIQHGISDALSFNALGITELQLGE